MWLYLIIFGLTKYAFFYKIIYIKRGKSIDLIGGIICQNIHIQYQ